MTSAIIFIGLALVFALGKIILEKRLAAQDAAGDERCLSDLAFSLDCSVYDLFIQAAAEWHFSREKIDSDFKNYMRNDQIPPYVHIFLDRSARCRETTYQELIYSGGRPPYL